MFDDWAWISYKRVIEEARKRRKKKREPSQLTSPAQKRYKRQRRKNDIYTTKGGHRRPNTGSPFTGKMKRFGTDRLRFENLREIIEENDIELSSLKPKDTLSPGIWDGEELKPEISDQLRRIADDFVDSLKLKIDIENIILVGSMAGYNWSDYSDIDLHIVLDFDKISQDKELLKKYFRLAKGKWNRQHDIKLYGHDVELYVEDINEERLPSAVYSVLRGEWISRMDPNDISIDYEGVEKKTKELIDQVDELQTLYEGGEYESAFSLGRRLREKISNFRQSGLEQEGEFSNENLSFKLLRRHGFLDRINNYTKMAYKEMRTTSL